MSFFSASFKNAAYLLSYFDRLFERFGAESIKSCKSPVNRCFLGFDNNRNSIESREGLKNRCFSVLIQKTKASKI